MNKPCTWSSWPLQHVYVSAYLDELLPTPSRQRERLFMYISVIHRGTSTDTSIVYSCIEQVRFKGVYFSGDLIEL